MFQQCLFEMQISFCFYVLVPVWTSASLPHTPPQSVSFLSCSQTDNLVKGNTIIQDGGESDMVIRKKGRGVGSRVLGGVGGGGWGGQISAECWISSFLTLIPRSIPEFPQGAVMFSRLHALYNGNIHRIDSTCDRDHITGQYVVERLHITAYECYRETKHKIRSPYDFKCERHWGAHMALWSLVSFHVNVSKAIVQVGGMMFLAVWQCGVISICPRRTVWTQVKDTSI